MPSYNKVTLIGRLVRDPELSYTSAGLAVAKFTIAVDRFGKNPQTGEKKADFFRCSAWRQKAEFVSNYVQKGRLVVVDGRIELNEYTDKEGQKKYSTDIVCDNVETLDSNRDGAGEAAPAGGYAGNSNGGSSNGGGRGGQDSDDGGGYFADEEAAPAPRRQPAPQAQAAPPQQRPAQRPAAPAAAPAARPAAKPAPAPAAAYTDDDFDDSDPFADE